MKDQGYLSVRDVAQLMGVSARTVGDLIRRGRLAAARITDRGRWYISEDAVSLLLKGTAAQAEQQAEQR